MPKIGYGAVVVVATPGQAITAIAISLEARLDGVPPSPLFFLLAAFAAIIAATVVGTNDHWVNATTLVFLDTVDGWPGAAVVGFFRARCS